MEERDYIAVKERVVDRLLAIPGVHAVGVGDKLTGGERTGETSIRVYVMRKRPLAEVVPEERVPPEIEGVRTDVVERPMPVEEQVPGIPASAADREDAHEYRPVRGGTQLSRGGSSGAGTLGCICDVTGDATKVIALTCHHVVYSPTSVPNHEEVGQPAGQSSSSASCDDIIGRALDAQYDEDVDVALIQLNGGTQYLAQIEGAGVVHGAGPHPAKNDPVTKRGRSTGLTGGIVDDISTDGDINNPDGTVRRHYKRAIQVQANPDPATPGPTDFTRAGDSGAAYLNAAGQVIGIHFSGAPGTGFSWCTPIENIINKFNGVAIDGGPTLPPARHVALSVSSAAAAGDVRTVPTAMTADEQPRAVITPGAARRLEEEVRTSSRRGAWYADLYRRHGEEVAALVHKNRRVTVVWHRSGAAELAQWLVRTFSQQGIRVPEEIQGRPVRACVDDLAAALVRNGSSALIADLRSALPTLPDVAGLTDHEIIDRLRIETA
jgi:hypothetical protein